MNSADGSDVQVEALEVIEAYRRMLNDANHQIAVLQAQVKQLQETHGGPVGEQRRGQASG